MSFFALLITFFSFPCFALSSSELEGSWKAVGYYYQNTFVEPTDKTLILTYEFRADGTDTLAWHHEGEKSFCERRGTWFLAGDILHDEITWVNPENGMDCSSDPDMQQGHKSEAKIWIDQGNLMVEIPFGEEALIYTWAPYESLITP